MINIWENIWASVHLFLYPLKYLWFIAVCIWSKEYPLHISEHFCLALPTSSVSEMVPPCPLATSLTAPHLPLTLWAQCATLSSAPSAGGSGLSGKRRESHSGGALCDEKESSGVDAFGGELERTGNRGLEPFFESPVVSAGWTPWRCSLLFGCSYCANFWHPHQPR